MVSNVSVAGLSSSLRTNEDAKEKILFTMQIAVKEIQYYCSLNDLENGMSSNAREVHQLCDSLDKTLFHGLCEYQKGYWPFVKEFTHSNTITYIESLENSTEIQCGRAWLCLALNENSLESYFRSFQQNPNLVQKHYSNLALLRDEQRMQLVLMLMAGLENVPINLDLENVSCGSGLSFFSSYIYKVDDRAHSSCSNDIPMHEYPHSETENCLKDDDSGVIGCENAVEIIDEPDTSVDNTESNSAQVPVSNTQTPEEEQHCLTSNEFERITKYLNLSPESELASSTDLEVIRTKVVRRLKKTSSQKSTLPEATKRISCPENFSKPENSNNFTDRRLSKTTADSGLSLETQSSSDRDSPELTYEHFHQKILSFEVDVFHPDIAVKFSTPDKQKQENHRLGDSYPVCPISVLSCQEERGVPEGQEDPVKDSYSHGITSRLPLLPGNDGLDVNEDSKEVEEEEISIYDISKNPKLFSKVIEIGTQKKEAADVEDMQSEFSSSFTSTLHATPEHCGNLAVEKCIDPVEEELVEMMKNNVEEKLDISLDNSTLLYLLVEIFEFDEETYYKMFYCYLHFPKGNDQISLLLLSNKCLYILKPGNSEQKFILHDSMPYSNIDYISVLLNYQGFTVMSKNYKQIQNFYAANEDLTRSIISHLEVAIRRTSPRQILPAVSTNASLQMHNLKKLLASKLHCLRDEILIHHFVLAWWEDYHGNTLPDTPAGPRLDGSLMYRHKFLDSNVITVWQPGHFILNGSVLYCVEEGCEAEPLFFVQMWVPHCKGCRRLHPPVRPYSFEIILFNGDSLQLAAAGEEDASTWLQAFLQSVSLAGHLVDCNDRNPSACSIILFNDNISIIEEIKERTLVQSIGIANITDLVSVCTHSSISKCLFLEFEIAEADKSCGEWIIVFDSENEREKFLDVLKWRWLNLFKIDLQVSSIKDLSLVTKLQQFAQNGEASKQRLHDYCYES